MDLERCRKDAKALVRAHRAGDAEAHARAAAVLGDRPRFQLSDAQHVVANEHGYRTWAELRRAAETAGELDKAAVVRMLVAARADGPTPLETALCHGARDAAEAIAEQGSPPAAVWSAAALGRLDLAQQLLDAPGDRQAILDEALCFAAVNGRDDAIAWLLETGADVNAAPFHGLTPLHLAVVFDRPTTTRLLRDAGADSTRRDRGHDRTPAGWARQLEHPGLVGLLEGFDSGLEYAPGEPVRLRVEHGRWYSFSDEGRAVELAGRPEGWREVARRIEEERVVNVSRHGVVSLMVMGPYRFAEIGQRVAEASLELYEELLDLN